MGLSEVLFAVEPELFQPAFGFVWVDAMMFLRWFRRCIRSSVPGCLQEYPGEVYTDNGLASSPSGSTANLMIGTDHGQPARGSIGGDEFFDNLIGSSPGRVLNVDAHLGELSSLRLRRRRAVENDTYSLATGG